MEWEPLSGISIDRVALLGISKVARRFEAPRKMRQQCFDVFNAKMSNAYEFKSGSPRGPAAKSDIESDVPQGYLSVGSEISGWRPEHRDKVPRNFTIFLHDQTLIRASVSRFLQCSVTKTHHIFFVMGQALL